MPLKFSLLKAQYNFFFLQKLSMESHPFDQSPNWYFNVSKNARVCVWKLKLEAFEVSMSKKNFENFKQLCLLDWKTHKAKSNYKCLFPCVFVFFPKQLKVFLLHMVTSPVLNSPCKELTAVYSRQPLWLKKITIIL